MQHIQIAGEYKYFLRLGLVAKIVGHKLQRLWKPTKILNRYAPQGSETAINFFPDTLSECQGCYCLFLPPTLSIRKRRFSTIISDLIFFAISSTSINGVYLKAVSVYMFSTRFIAVADIIWFNISCKTSSLHIICFYRSRNKKP